MTTEPQKQEPVRREAGIHRARSRWLARASAYGAALSLLVTQFLGVAFPPFKERWIEPYLDYKWVVVERVRTVNPHAGLKVGLAVAVGVLALTALVGFSAAKARGHAVERLELAGSRLRLVKQGGGEIVLEATDVRGATLRDGALWIALAGGDSAMYSGPDVAGWAEQIEAWRAIRQELTVGSRFAAAGAAVAKHLSWAGFLPLLMSSTIAGSAAAAGSWSGAVLLSLLTLVWLVASAWGGSRTRVVVGAEGVEVPRWQGSQRVLFREVEAVEAHAQHLELVRSGGSRVRVTSDDPAALKGAVERALSAHRRSRPKLSDEQLQLLRRGNQSFSEWRTALQKILSRQDYRQEGLSRDALEQLIDDPEVEPEQRVGAALALPKDEATRSRIRIAARDAMDDRVRAALEAAAEDELAEDELARVARRLAK